MSVLLIAPLWIQFVHFPFIYFCPGRHRVLFSPEHIPFWNLFPSGHMHISDLIIPPTHFSSTHLLPAKVFPKGHWHLPFLNIPPSQLVFTHPFPPYKVNPGLHMHLSNLYEPFIHFLRVLIQFPFNIFLPWGHIHFPFFNSPPLHLTFLSEFSIMALTTNDNNNIKISNLSFFFLF